MYVGVVFRDTTRETPTANARQGNDVYVELADELVPQTGSLDSGVQSRPQLYKVSSSYIAETEAQVAEVCQQRLVGIQSQYPRQVYRIWIGKLTHEVRIPPAPRFEIVELR